LTGFGICTGAVDTDGLCDGGGAPVSGVCKGDCAGSDERSGDGSAADGLSDPVELSDGESVTAGFSAAAVVGDDAGNGAGVPQPVNNSVKISVANISARAFLTELFIVNHSFRYPAHRIK